MPKSAVALYYWLTPVFWLLDVAFGWNVRAAALDGEPGGKTVYYLFCLGCGAVIWFWPQATKVVALTEASLNILLLVLSVLLPYYRIINQLAASAPIVEPFTFGIADAFSLVLSGTIWTISIRMTAASIERR